MEKREIVVIVLAIALLGISMIVSNITSDLTGYVTSKNQKVGVSVSNDNKPVIAADIFIDYGNDKKGRGYFPVGITKNNGKADLLLKEGTHKIKIIKNGFKTYEGIIIVRDGYNFLRVELNKIIIKCQDGTEFISCSSNRPYFCYSDGSLKLDCQTCGCIQGKVCLSDGSCV